MSGITAPTSASGGLQGVDINKLFDTVNNTMTTVNTCASLGQDLGNAFGNAFNPQQPQQPYGYDPNTRIVNNQPYNGGVPYSAPYSSTPPYQQQQPYQAKTYGYGYGNIGNGMYSNTEYQNGPYPGISNPGYGM